MTRWMYILAVVIMTIAWTLYIKHKVKTSWFYSIGWGFCAAAVLSMWLPIIFGAK